MSELKTAVFTSKWSALQLLASQSFLAGFTLALLFAVANTRFLLDFGTDSLPIAYVVTSLFVPTVSLLYKQYAQKVTERRLLLTVTLIICAIYLISWLAASIGAVRWISFVLLVLFNTLFIFQVIIITLQAARLFDIRQMKTSYPLVLASQTGGVIFGGLSVTLLANIIGGVSNLLLVCLVLSILQYVMTWLTMNNYFREFSHKSDKQNDATLRDVLAQPYARAIFIYRFFSGYGTELIIIIFTIQAARRFQTADSLASFFGNFMAAGTFLTLLFLLLVAGRLLKRFGLRFGIMSNPIVAGLIILALFVTQLTGLSLVTLIFVLAVVARVIDFIFSVSLTEPSMKTMYQALPEQRRSALITVVEAVSQPLSIGIVGGSLLMFRTFNLSSDAFLFTYTGLVCLIWSYFGWRTYRLYTTTLLEKLSQRTVSQVDLAIDDPETMTIVTNLAQSNNLAQVRLALNLLEQEGKVHALALSETLQISVDTVRRDLQALADAGKVLRVHGGALPASPKSMDFVSRQSVSSAAKLAVAKTAVSLIKNHQVIFMDNGTTTLMVAQQLPHNLQATIVTHSLPLALALVDYPDIDVIMIGGKLDKQERIVVGVSVVETYRRIQADVCLLGICSLHPETGITVPSLEESYVKQAMIEQSSEVAALATKDKLGTAAPYRAAPIADLTHLVTETAVSETILAPYREVGITVIQ